MEQELKNETPEEQTSEPTTDPSLLFAKALSFILKNGEGIVVDTNNEVNFSEEVKKVIVFKFSDKIHIYKCDEDIAEGTAVHLQQEEEN
jgi:hypothetical protein